jgi:uncharacterized protein
MSEQENVQLIKQGYQQFQAGDLQGVLSNFSDDAELIYPGPPEAIPFAGTHRGKEAITQYFALSGSLLEFGQLEMKDIVAEGDQVVVLGTAHITARQTGKKFITDFAHVYTVKGGKATKYQVFDDSARVAAALA